MLSGVTRYLAWTLCDHFCIGGPNSAVCLCLNACHCFKLMQPELHTTISQDTLTYQSRLLKLVRHVLHRRHAWQAFIAGVPVRIR